MQTHMKAYLTKRRQNLCVPTLLNSGGETKIREMLLECYLKGWSIPSGYSVNTENGRSRREMESFKV
jgi:hypothetical protein